MFVCCSQVLVEDFYHSDKLVDRRDVPTCQGRSRCPSGENQDLPGSLQQVPDMGSKGVIC